MINQRASARRNGLLCLTLAFSLLGGCVITPKVENIPEKITSLEAEHKYGAALRTIEKALLILATQTPTTTSSPQATDQQSQLSAEGLESRRIDITLAAAQYELNTIKKAQNLAEKSEWTEATAIYHAALLHFPESTTLADASSKLNAARDAQKRKLRLKYRQSRAKIINAEIANMQQLVDAAPNDPSSQTELSRLVDEQRTTAEALLVEAQLMMAKSQWPQAKVLLALSNALRKDQRTDTALRVLNTKFKPTPSRKKRKRIRPVFVAKPKVDSGLFDAEMRDYFAALTAGQLPKARKHIIQALELSPNNKQGLDQKASLDLLIKETVNRHVESGKYLYSIGDIDNAIKDWELAYSLTPDNEALKERLDKAQRFQTRYESLK